MAASNLIVAAMEQLSLALRQALRAAAQNDKAQIAAHADRLSKLAWQIGLVTLAGWRWMSGVARKAATCRHFRQLWRGSNAWRTVP
ncbi:hypothetical protein QWZ10_14110 [Paracoccus cavernae]|uniref:Uncharacterized protein n=1 Tax=Paracoccus cavernae TaxID=1571207 RepID=A0ABT8D9M8_9RHOB|nr:hypothetical protein [Paracoccus cavernae]